MSEARHFADFESGVERALEAGALFGTCLTGSDSWPLAQAVDYLARADEHARRRGLAVAFETHRGRPTFNPWSTREILRALPELRLTCDLESLVRGLRTSGRRRGRARASALPRAARARPGRRTRRGRKCRILALPSIAATSSATKAGGSGSGDTPAFALTKS